MKLADLLHGLRLMRKNPVFTLTAVLTLALAIGANTAMFTVIRAVLLNPLEYPEPDQLVRLTGGATPTRFAEMKAGARSFSQLGAHTWKESITLSGGNGPEVLAGMRVSANFLRILAVNPLLGRSFLAAEDAPGGTAVALISAELWRRRFGSDPRIAGRTVTLAATNYTIVGVLPTGFQFPVPGIDVWMTAPSEFPAFAVKSRALSPFLTIFGRLRAGTTLAEANADLKVLRGRYALSHPAMLDAKAKTPVEAATMKEQLVSNVRVMLWMLFGAVVFVLTIACANVANLLLARAASRTREFAIRSALGAARFRLMGQLLVESLLLSVSGGVLGVLLAAFLLRAIPAMAALNLPRLAEIHLDWAVLGFAAAVSMATGFLFGLAPALGASRPDLVNVLRSGGVGGDSRVSTGALAGLNVRHVLSVGQVALSVVLLIGAALLMESVAYLRNVEVGFKPASLLTGTVTLSPLRYDTDRKQAAFFGELTTRLAAIPGSESATVAMTLPMTDYAGSPVQDAAKPPLPLNQRLIARVAPIEPDYFRTLQISMKRGREFNARDTEEAQRVAIIDEGLARRFWPAYPMGLDPVGQRLLIGGVNLKTALIIGIASDVHQNLDNRKDWRESVYVAFSQSPTPAAMIAVRTASDPLVLSKAVREQVRALDPDEGIAQVRTMDDLLEAQVGQRRLVVTLLGSLAVAALGLALVGIYGVMAYTVTERVREMGIRRALGAQQADILRLIVGRGVVLTLTGIALGIAGAVALTRVMTALLFHVSATDPATYGGIAAMFLLVSAAACYLPARRAARIDPMAALRV